MSALKHGGLLQRAGDALIRTWASLVHKPWQLSNVEDNRRLWDSYARRWDGAHVPLEDARVSDADRTSYVKYLGDEWGRTEDVDRIVAEYIFPFISTDSVVAEIGVGGGRIASRVAPRTRELNCFDISSAMLKTARAALAGHSNVRFVLLDDSALATKFADRFDFVYAFDVFVHLDLHTTWRYLRDIRATLRPGGRLFIHTANLKAPGGWDRFARQREYHVEGHYFSTPELIEILVDKSNFRIVKRSTPDPTNFYLNRDYLLVLEK